MDLLPKTHTEFSEKNYWENFFKKWGPKAFEWYGEFPVLCGLLHKYVKPVERVLMIGCGNSSLSADMYDVGYKSITNIDISTVAIKQMTEKNREQRPDMLFLKMDMMQMEFSDEEFSVVLDKGTLDALMTDSLPATIENVEKMFAEISRVLKNGGRYFCVSLAQEHILLKVVEYFAEKGWMVRVCRVSEDEEAKNKDFSMPVFVFVCTKMKFKMPKPILECCVFEDQPPSRYDSTEKLISAVKELQQYALVKQQLGKSSMQGEQLAVELFSSASKVSPRYVLTVVDAPSSTAMRMGPRAFAIFIVPEGRESHWLFSTNEGRLVLAKDAGYSRLVVVTLNREHTYTGLEQVKAELSTKVMELAPPGINDKQVLFLSEGNDINRRQVMHRGTSALSGDLVVEDVEHDNALYRRLVFLSSPNVVQSEAKLMKAVRRKKGKKGGGGGGEQLVVDPNHLCCNYYSVIIAGMAFVEHFTNALESGLSLLMLGLGGGGLPHFIHKHYPKISCEVVEIDEAVVSVAQEWFGFHGNEKMQIKVADGLAYVKQLAEKGEQRDVIVLDVDSKDVSAGLSSPPQAFLEEEFLKDVAKILSSRGVFILNLVCTNDQLKDSVVQTVRSVFPNLYKNNITEDVNEIIFALPDTRQTKVEVDKDGKLPKEIEQGLRTLQDSVRKAQKGGAAADRGNVFSLSNTLQELTME